ncbi:hypothetical protein PybrP1_003568 [[Pythium] brassicae (nom. inval.)]|nr:hypothetical protein PybrP1_003568 [[Pythium] brassicae (nom. inval.)]
MSKSKAAATSSASLTAPASAATSSNGTLHVKVLRARNLPRMDFGKRQDPFVLVQLEGSSPKSFGTTDPAFQGGTDPEWNEKLNNELELFYDANLHDKGAVLTIEVYSDETGEDLIGTGQINVTKVAKDQTKVRLKDGLGGAENRGEVLLSVWFGPPVRKAFRAAQRASKLLDIRDSVVSTLWNLVGGLLESKYLQGPTDFAKKHRSLSVAAAALLGIAAAGLIAGFLAIAVPIAIVAAFTLPFWIIPFLVTAFFTAPLWIPVVLVLGLFAAFIATFVFGLSITSRPVRRQGALLSSRIKHSEMGKRVVYEKEM